MHRKYLFELEGMAFLGFLALIVAGLVFFAFLPVILQSSISSAVTVLFYVLIWLFTYIAMIIGAVLYYLVKPRIAEGRKATPLPRTAEAEKKKPGPQRRHKKVKKK